MPQHPQFSLLAPFATTTYLGELAVQEYADPSRSFREPNLRKQLSCAFVSRQRTVCVCSCLGAQATFPWQEDTGLGVVFQRKINLKGTPLASRAALGTRAPPCILSRAHRTVETKWVSPRIWKERSLPQNEHGCPRPSRQLP